MTMTLLRPVLAGHTAYVGYTNVLVKSTGGLCRETVDYSGMIVTGFGIAIHNYQ